MSLSIASQGRKLQASLSGAVPSSGSVPTPIVPSGKAPSEASSPIRGRAGQHQGVSVSAGSELGPERSREGGPVAAPLSRKASPAVETKAGSTGSPTATTSWPGAGSAMKALVMFALLATGRCAMPGVTHGMAPGGGASVSPSQEDSWGEKPRHPRELGDVATFCELVADVRKAGPKSSAGTNSKFLLPEQHGLPGNIELITKVMKCAHTDEPLTLYKEVVATPDMTSAIDALWSRADLSAVEHMTFHVTKENPAKPDPVVRKKGTEMFHTLIGGRVNMKVLGFGDPSRSDLQAFIDDRTCAIASLGLFHAIARATGRDSLQIPGFKSTVSNPLFPTHSPEAFAQIWDGFMRLHEAGRPTVMMITNETLAGLGPKPGVLDFLKSLFGVRESTYSSRLLQHYVDLGFFVVTAPVHNSLNVVIVGTDEMQPLLQTYAKRNNLQAYYIKPVESGQPPGVKESKRSEL